MDHRIHCIACLRRLSPRAIPRRHTVLPLHQALRKPAATCRAGVHRVIQKAKGRAAIESR
ncbi:unnamed protein product [Linum tenue]|uniref:Uncharacterized protein n=1 Tax=Linum tenue TaxID=586396 RepID=A0AAV0M2T7_9ROSI|nr:unnamed protein product [Linum tenue]